MASCLLLDGGAGLDRLSGVDRLDGAELSSGPLPRCTRNEEKGARSEPANAPGRVVRSPHALASSFEEQSDGDWGKSVQALVLLGWRSRPAMHFRLPRVSSMGVE